MPEQEPKRKRSTLDVYKSLGLEPETQQERWRKVYPPVKPGEANVLLSKGYVVARGRKKGQLALLIPVSAYQIFIGQMRHKPRPEARAIDSKTHAYAGPQGFKHVRNTHYSPLADFAMMAIEGQLGDEIVQEFRNENEELMRVQ